MSATLLDYQHRTTLTCCLSSAAVNSVSNNIISGPISGIMGLGFQALSNTQSTPFWQTLLNNGQLANSEMSFYIARNAATVSSNSQETDGGVFTLGGTNSSLFQGDIDFNNFPSGSTPSYWLQTVSQLTLNGNSVDIGSSSSNVAAIDTGTTLLGGPTEAVQAFWGQVSGSRSLSNGMFAFRTFFLASHSFFLVLTWARCSLQHRSDCYHLLRRQVLAHQVRRHQLRQYRARILPRRHLRCYSRSHHEREHACLDHR